MGFNTAANEPSKFWQMLITILPKFSKFLTATGGGDLELGIQVAVVLVVLVLVLGVLPLGDRAGLRAERGREAVAADTSS